MHIALPDPLRHLVALFAPAAEILAIVLAAWLLRLLVRLLIARVCTHYGIVAPIAVGARRVSTFLITAAATILVLQRLGVSGTVLWTAFTGFAAVAAVAFFAAWSVLSNLFCTLLILATRPFRLGDHIEMLENGDKPGLGGRVTDINLIHTTLAELGADGTPRGSVLKIPNSLFFQRTVRRLPGDGERQRWFLRRTPGHDDLDV
jgi:small-conductance mechanosensitive channel